MTNDEQREQVIQNLNDLLKRNPFTFEVKVKKKPRGIKVIYEVTQEEMDLLLKKTNNKKKNLI